MKTLKRLLLTLAALVIYHCAVGGILLSSMLQLPFNAPLTPLQQLRLVTLWPELIASDFYASRFITTQLDQIRNQLPKPTP